MGTPSALFDGIGNCKGERDEQDDNGNCGKQEQAASACWQGTAGGEGQDHEGRGEGQEELIDSRDREPSRRKPAFPYPQSTA